MTADDSLKTACTADGLASELHSYQNRWFSSSYLSLQMKICHVLDHLCAVQVAQSYGLLLGTIVMVPKTAQTMAAILMLTFVLTGGYFVRGMLCSTAMSCDVLGDGDELKPCGLGKLCCHIAFVQLCQTYAKMWHAQYQMTSVHAVLAQFTIHCQSTFGCILERA